MLARSPSELAARVDTQSASLGRFGAELVPLIPSRDAPGLWAALGLITLAYFVARYLKKTDRLKKPKRASPSPSPAVRVQ